MKESFLNPFFVQHFCVLKKKPSRREQCLGKFVCNVLSEQLYGGTYSQDPQNFIPRTEFLGKISEKLIFFYEFVMNEKTLLNYCEMCGGFFLHCCKFTETLFNLNSSKGLNVFHLTR